MCYVSSMVEGTLMPLRVLLISIMGYVENKVCRVRLHEFGMVQL